jgi:hypothetical protein
MTLLDSASLSALMERFDSFNDAVVRKVTIDLAPSDSEIEVVIEAHDYESPSHWSMVTLRMVACRTYRLEEGMTSYIVLSSGLQVGFVDGKVILFLEAYPDEDRLPEIKNNRAYIIGRELHWSARHIE